MAKWSSRGADKLTNRNHSATLNEQFTNDVTQYALLELCYITHVTTINFEKILHIQIVKTKASCREMCVAEVYKLYHPQRRSTTILSRSQTIDNVGQLLWAWFSFLRKSEDEVVEP